jgi:hypothetical protein
MSDNETLAKGWLLPEEIKDSKFVMIQYTNSYDMSYAPKGDRIAAVQGRTLEGFVITNKSKWEDAVSRFLNKTYPIKHWLNFQHTEFVEFEDWSTYIHFKVSPLTQEEFTVIDNLCGRQYGVFPNALFEED